MNEPKNQFIQYKIEYKIIFMTIICVQKELEVLLENIKYFGFIEIVDINFVSDK